MFIKITGVVVLLGAVLTRYDPTFTTMAEGQVPKADDAGKLIYGGATVDADNKWTFDESITVPQASLNLSETLSISEATFAILLREKSGSSTHALVEADITPGGTTPPFLAALGAQQMVTAQPDDSTVITTNPLLLPTLASFDNQTDSFFLRANGPMSNVRLTLTDVTSGVPLKYLPDRKAVEEGTGGFEFVAGDVEINMNSDAPNTASVFNVGFTPLRAIPGKLGTILVEADNMDLLGNPTGVPFVRNVIQKLVQTDIATTKDVANVPYAYTRLNVEHSSPAAVAGGVVSLYLPTSTADTAHAFTQSADSGGAPECTTAGLDTFAPGDIVAIKGEQFNKGLYEVDEHVGALLKIRGAGGTPPAEGWSRTDFVTEDAPATITKVNVSVIRAGSAGEWEVGAGSAAPLAFRALVTGPPARLDTVRELSMVFDGTEQQIVFDSAQSVGVGATVNPSGTVTVGEEGMYQGTLRLEVDKTGGVGLTLNVALWLEVKPALTGVWQLLNGAKSNPAFANDGTQNVTLVANVAALAGDEIRVMSKANSGAGSLETITQAVALGNIASYAASLSVFKLGGTT